MNNDKENTLPSIGQYTIKKVIKFLYGNSFIRHISIGSFFGFSIVMIGSLIVDKFLFNIILGVTLIGFIIAAAFYFVDVY